jgi:transcriptional regulator with XRE-family HTH domain
MTLKVGRCLLVQRLRQAGMTQQELADKIGMNKRQVSRYATGDIKSMSLSTAVIIADAIGCNPRDLYEWIPAKRKGSAKGES